MRVIRNNDTIKVTCPHCKSVLAVGVSDVMVIELCHHGPGQFVHCPLCTATVGIPFDKIPVHWRDRLFED